MTCVPCPCASVRFSHYRTAQSLLSSAVSPGLMSLFVLPPTRFKLAAQRIQSQERERECVCVYVCVCVCMCVWERERERGEKHHPVTMVKGEKKSTAPARSIILPFRCCAQPPPKRKQRNHLGCQANAYLLLGFLSCSFLVRQIRMVEGTPPMTLPWIPSEARLCNFHPPLIVSQQDGQIGTVDAVKTKKGKKKKKRKAKRKKGVLCVRKERERKERHTQLNPNWPIVPILQNSIFISLNKRESESETREQPHPRIYSLLLFSSSLSSSNPPFSIPPTHITHHYTMEAPLPAGW